MLDFLSTMTKAKDALSFVPAFEKELLNEIATSQKLFKQRQETNEKNRLIAKKRDEDDRFNPLIDLIRYLLTYF